MTVDTCMPRTTQLLTLCSLLGYVKLHWHAKNPRNSQSPVIGNPQGYLPVIGNPQGYLPVIGNPQGYLPVSREPPGISPCKG